LARAHDSGAYLAAIVLGLVLCVWRGDPRNQRARPVQAGQGTGAAGQPYPLKARIVAGPEVLVSRDEHFAHVETMLAVNPTDPRYLLASCSIRPEDKEGEIQSRTRAYVSRDAGNTWKASPLPEEELWDPVVGFTPRGSALLVALRPAKQLWLFRSEDGGDTWKDRTELAYADNPMVAVDWTRGERRGLIYVSGRREGPSGQDDADPLVVQGSADEGRTFAATVVVEKPKAVRGFDLRVLQDGTLFVPFKTLTEEGDEQIACARSSDGGRTFSPPFPIATRRFETRGRYADHAPPAFAAGPRGGGERLYAVYNLCRGDANARLVLRHFDDGGRTWDEATDIARGVADEVTHGAANVSVNGSGVVGISWLQRSIGPTPPQKQGDHVVVNFNETYDVFFSASLDGGETFLAPVRITSRSSKPQGRVLRFWPGHDYILTAAASDGTFHLLWPDARTGLFQLYARAVRVEWLRPKKGMGTIVGTGKRERPNPPPQACSLIPRVGVKNLRAALRRVRSRRRRRSRDPNN
jgi:hypothetical protein